MQFSAYEANESPVTTSMSVVQGEESLLLVFAKLSSSPERKLSMGSAFGFGEDASAFDVLRGVDKALTSAPGRPDGIACRH